MDTKCVISKRVWSVVLAAAGLFTAPLSATLQAEEAAAQTAQADDVSLSEDGDITVGTAGHYYVNMPVTGTNTLTITADDITDGKGTFKVYDDGGKGGNYSDGCNGTLVLTAPTGYVLQLAGDIYTETVRDKLNIYNNSNTSGTPLLINVSSSSSGTKTDITTVTSLSNVMTIYFSSDNSGNYAGLDLTVIISKDESTNSESTNSEYTYLKEQIGSGGDVKLVRGTYTYGDGDGDTFVIYSGEIDGNGSVIDMANSGYRAFEIKGSGVTIKNLTIKNANFNGKGGAIYFDEQGTVENCTFIDNEASEDGGAVYFNDRGTVIDCYFSGNNALQKGGAVYLNQKGTIENCDFVNSTANYGGAVYINKSNYGGSDVINCDFIDNTATTFNGGAIWLYTGSVTNCDFINNTATAGNGGAIWFQTGSGGVTNCYFINNTAEKGGAILFQTGTGSVTNCDFSNNTAENGGATIHTDGSINIDGSEVTANGTDKGIYAGDGVVLDWTDATDFIFASSYEVDDDGVVKTADGRRFVVYTVDNTNPESPVETPVAIISGTISDLSTIAGKMLRPLDGYFVSLPEDLDIAGRTPDFVIGSVSYYQIAANENVTVEVIQQGVKFTGTDMPAGTTFNADYTQATFAMPAGTDVAITGIHYGITEVPYIDADGSQTTTPIATKVNVLDGTETTLGKVGEDTWYVALPADENGGRDLTGYGQLMLRGNVNLILADGAEMKATGDCAILGNDYAGLTLYGQSEQTGVLTAECTADDSKVINISGADLVINGGCLTAKGDNADFDIFLSNGNLTVNGGTIFDTRNLKISDGNATFNGGTLTGLHETINPGQEDNPTNYLGFLDVSGGDITVTGGTVVGYSLKAIFNGSTGGNVTISGGTLDCAHRELSTDVSFTITGGKIKLSQIICPQDNNFLSLSKDDDYISSVVFISEVTIPQGFFLTDGEKIHGSADGDYTLPYKQVQGSKVTDGRYLVKATPLATGGLYLAYDNPSGASLLTAGTVALYPTGIKFTEQADGSFTAEVVLSDQPLPGVPQGCAVILASATDGAPLSDVWLMASTAVSGEGKTPEALKDAYDARTDRLINFVAADGTQTVAQLIAAATGRTAVTDADCSDYIVFVLSGDRFVAAMVSPDVIPAAGRCLLVVPKLNMLRHLDMGDTSGGTTAGARTLRLGGGDNATTGILQLPADGDATAQEYFGLDGRPVGSRPLRKGVYIRRGSKLVVR